MKQMTLAQWEEKYDISEIKRFDQKYTMFNRPAWDPEINGLIDDWAMTSVPRDEKGFTIEDKALSAASRLGTMMGIFNTHKPNPNKMAQLLMTKMTKGNPNIEAMAYKLPEGMKIDPSNLQSVTEKIKKSALWFGADTVGICKLDRRWVYSHSYDEKPKRGMDGRPELAHADSVVQEIPEEFKYAIVMCYEMDYDLLKYYSNSVSITPTTMGYSQMAITNHYLSAFIRYLGYHTINCTTNDVALSIPMAMQAGLGDLARNGLLVTPKYGPRVRISKIITDLPLVPDKPIDFGVTEFCESCKICAEKCPSQSIQYGDRTTEPNSISNVGGVLKWPTHAETCRLYWSKMKGGCSVCINCCPFNKPDTPLHQAVRWFADHMRWADPLYVSMDKLFGYGRPKSVENFWEEWNPQKNK